MSELGHCERCKGHLCISTGKWRYCRNCDDLVPQSFDVCPKCSEGLSEKMASTVCCSACGFPAQKHPLTKEMATMKPAPLPQPAVTSMHTPLLDPLALHKRIERLEAEVAALKNGGTHSRAPEVVKGKR